MVCHARSRHRGCCTQLFYTCAILLSSTKLCSILSLGPEDHLALKGHLVTMGLRNVREQQEKRPIDRSSTLANALRSAGAIIFCKTTMTQLGETWGGGSPAHGDTLNPWDTLRTSGGSSCGEGALLGAAGSPFGIGSDVGGSVRIPASFCGICALKPTAFRLTFNWETGQTILGHPGDYGVPWLRYAMFAATGEMLQIQDT